MKFKVILLPTPCTELRRGFTLVEMLVALALTLLMMAAVAQIFAMMGQGVNGSRSMAELNDRMRATAYRLRQDLAGITVTPDPPVKPEINSGYLEIIEGRETDLVTYASGQLFRKDGGALDGDGKWVGNPEPYEGVVGSDDRLVGDVDDVILFTTRSPADQFAGVASAPRGSHARSPFAEVIWFCRPTVNTADPRTYTLHRRQRLISAHPGVVGFSDSPVPNTLPFTNWKDLADLTDVSCRVQGNLAIPNCLGDLTKRENRFLHVPTFPHEFDSGNAALTFDRTSPRYGEDILLTNVIGFDVRVWDPEAPVQFVPSSSTSSVALTPGDSAYTNPVLPVVFRGAFVDLGNGLVANSTLSGPINPLAAIVRAATYCTWSSHYAQLADTLGRTAPPYAVPLEGLEIRLRCYEPSSKQVRQITIRHNFD
jgi:prepilin-type N-terminal cleavage/methylation domain-containing protein